MAAGLKPFPTRSLMSSPAEIEYAQRLVIAFAEAQAGGNCALAFGGQLLDLPIVERARRSLAVGEFLTRRMTH